MFIRVEAAGEVFVQTLWLGTEGKQKRIPVWGAAVRHFTSLLYSWGRMIKLELIYIRSSQNTKSEREMARTSFIASCCYALDKLTSRRQASWEHNHCRSPCAQLLVTGITANWNSSEQWNPFTTNFQSSVWERILLLKQWYFFERFVFVWSVPSLLSHCDLHTDMIQIKN